ncbi:hypothetical protein PIB30_112976, partial [Stylosanthes scabra]|nr:hypothetical protein [Stylosanthes scabra]
PLEQLTKAVTVWRCSRDGCPTVVVMVLLQKKGRKMAAIECGGSRVSDGRFGWLMDVWVR